MSFMIKVREHTTVILVILVGFIIFSFVFTIFLDWGMGGLKGGAKRGVIAKVDGKEILVKNFYDLYQDEVQRRREQSPDGDIPSYQLQQIENQVFESLVQQNLLTGVIKKLNLEATDKEIVNEIINNPPSFLRQNEAFLDSTGNFSMERYSQALANPSADWVQVENYVRYLLPQQKLDKLLKLAVTASDEDARLDYLKKNVKSQVNYILYDLARFAQAVLEPSEKDINNYYKEHKAEYEENEKRAFKYVLIEIKPTKADSEAVYEQADELLQDVLSGKDFAELAEIFSKDPGSAERGGDLGYFGRDQMVKPFEEAAFGAEIGQIVGPVKSTFGLHIIKVEDKKREDGELKVKARHILLKFEVTNKTREALRDEAIYLSEYSRTTNLDSVAKVEGFTVQEASPFFKESFIPGIGMELSVSRWAFRAKVGDISDPFTTEKGYLVAQLAEITPKQVRPLEEVGSQIVEKLKSEKRLELAQAQAEAAYEKIQSGVPFDQIAAEDSLTVEETDLFSVESAPPFLRREYTLLGTILGLEIGEYSKPIEGNRGYYIVQLVNKQPFDEVDFVQKKESIRKQLEAERKNQIYQLWYKKLKENADIVDYRNEYL
ncbi:peptidylprolyl isomerase [candidate division KSB1 bacterium]|nr:peptidylprolyl isomerase [candidate division KSB1 bacterium]